MRKSTEKIFLAQQHKTITVQKQHVTGFRLKNITQKLKG